MRILSSFLQSVRNRVVGLNYAHKLSTKALASLTLGTAVLALGATPALANHINTAQAMTTCTSYVLEVNASQLVSGMAYTISYTITLKPGTGASTVVTGSIPLTGPTNGTYTDTITKQINLITDNYTLSGTASLVGHNSVAISFAPNASLSCVCPD